MNKNLSEKKDKIKGLFYGQAIGDALGLSAEFLNKENIEKYYGEKIRNKTLTYSDIVQDYHRTAFKIGDWTDDTDQMILVTRELIEQKGEINVFSLAKKFKFWYNKGFPELGDFAGSGIGNTFRWCVNDEEFLNSPFKVSKEIKSASNGAVMRTAITGIFPNHIELSETQSKLTHNSSNSIRACKCLSSLINKIYNNENNNENINEYWKECQNYLSKYQQTHLIKFSSCGNCTTPLYWVNYALTCLEKKTVYEIFLDIINSSGDTDTNCAVVGAVLGCYYGYTNLQKQIPENLFSGLINKEFLEQEINKLCDII